MVDFWGCIGYDYDPVTKTLSINEEGAETVRYIFDRYVAGAGSTMIAKELNQQGSHTIRGNPYWVLLRNLKIEILNLQQEKITGQNVQ